MHSFEHHLNGHGIFRYSIDGGDSEELVGLSARFGSLLPTKDEQALTGPLTLAEPFNSCSNYTSQVVSTFYCVFIYIPFELASLSY